MEITTGDHLLTLHPSSERGGVQLPSPEQRKLNNKNKRERMSVANTGISSNIFNTSSEVILSA